MGYRVPFWKRINVNSLKQWKAKFVLSEKQSKDIIKINYFEKFVESLAYTKHALDIPPKIFTKHFLQKKNTQKIQNQFSKENGCIENKWINPIQDGGSKRSPTSFSSVTSANVGLSPQNILTFIFNPFPTLM